MGANYSLFHLCVVCILAPFLKDDLKQEIIHVVVEFIADLMILFLCSAKLVSCALGKKTLLNQSKISSIFNYLPVSEGKDGDHCDNVSVSKQECIVDPSSQVNDSSIKQESVIEVHTPNLVMEPVTCSLDIMNDLDDFARYIEDGSKISASEKSKSLQRNGYRKILYFQEIAISYASNRVLFGKEISQLNVAKQEPFYDWKHGIQRFKRHASSAIHKNANVDLMHFKNIKI